MINVLYYALFVFLIILLFRSLPENYQNIGDENRLSIMVSNKKTVIIIGNSMVKAENINMFIVIILSRLFEIKKIKRCLNVTQLLIALNEIEINGNIIIASCGTDVASILNYDAVRAIQSVGAKITNFGKNVNYLLISSGREAIYEKMSNDPVYFPYFNIVAKDCRFNSMSIPYPDKYLVYDDKTYDLDRKMKCALETSFRGLTKFGMFMDKCVPMTDAQYDGDFKFMPKSDNCKMEIGDNNSIFGFQLNFDQHDGVKFYDQYDLVGNYVTLSEGEYNRKQFGDLVINSIYVPGDYYLFLLKDQIVVPHYGEKTVNKLNFIVNEFVIQKHYLNNAKLCSRLNGICQTYGPGYNIIPKMLFSTIVYVNLGEQVQSVSVYGDVFARDLIQSFSREQKSIQIYSIEFPRVTRSVVIN